MSDGRCWGLVGRFGLVYGPPLLMLRRTRSSVSSVCVFVVFLSYSGLVYLQSTIHQHLWNLLVIIRTPTTGAYSLSVYVGVDDIYFALNSRQQKGDL